MKKRRLHCPSCYHMLMCICGHPHFVHAGLYEEENCLERPCKCDMFEAIPGYTAKQMEHVTIPIEGLPNEG